jgi:hypothetical protein
MIWFFFLLKIFLAIPTPHWQCNLTKYEEDSETRPPFVNYGGRYNNKSSGEKRTFNSLAVHVCFIESVHLTT